MVKIVRERSGNLRKKEESQGKIREFDRLFQLKSFATPQVQLDDLSFCRVLYQEVMENFLRSGKNQGK